MRIAFIVESCGAGTSKNVISLAQNFSIDKANEITIFWSRHRASDEWMKFVRCKNIKFIQIDMFPTLGLSDIYSYVAIYRAFRTLGFFDVVHCHSSKAGMFGRMLPRSHYGKLIYTPHAFVTMREAGQSLSRLFFKIAERVLSWRTDHVIVVSQFEYNHALSLGISEKKLELIVNGVPSCVDNRASSKVRSLNENFIVGFFGRLDNQKNPRYFIQCVSSANLKNPSVKGHIFGTGPLMDELNSNSKDVAVSFFGWVNSTEYLDKVSILLCTSRYEGMPYVFLEALSAGIPIFSLHVGGTEEAIDHGKNGYVFAQDASQIDIAEKIVELAEDRQKYMEFCDHSRKISKAYTERSMVNKTLCVYEANN